MVIRRGHTCILTRYPVEIERYRKMILKFNISLTRYRVEMELYKLRNF